MSRVLAPKPGRGVIADKTIHNWGGSPHTYRESPKNRRYRSASAHASWSACGRRRIESVSEAARWKALRSHPRLLSALCDVRIWGVRAASRLEARGTDFS